MKVERVEGSIHRRLIDGELYVRCSKLGWWDKSIRRRKPGRSFGVSLTGERGRRTVRHHRRLFIAVDDQVYALLRAW